MTNIENYKNYSLQCIFIYKTYQISSRMKEIFIDVHAYILYIYFIPQNG